MNKYLLIAVLILVAGSTIAFLTIETKKDSPIATTTENLEPRNITLSNGKSFTLTIPASYEISVASEGLGRARFMAESPDGRLFVTDMKDLSDNSEGKIYILSEFNDSAKKFNKKETYLSELRNPNSLTFYTDESGVEWLYIALTDKLVRYRYSRGETTPTSQPETLATFPDYGLSYKYGGWHLTRTVIAHNDKIYVSAGSSCNSCEEKEEVRASITEMNPDGSNVRIIAHGLRNAVGIVSAKGAIYISNMGSDHLGDDKPEETFYKLNTKIEANYGWPYCYEYQKTIYTDDSQKWNTPIDCASVPIAQAVFPAHSAPLGVEYFDNRFLVALHGSSDIKRARGYSIVQVDANGNASDFITGFLDGITRNGRPAGILKKDNSSFYFTDDFSGVLYYVYKK